MLPTCWRQIELVSIFCQLLFFLKGSTLASVNSWQLPAMFFAGVFLQIFLADIYADADDIFAYIVCFLQIFTIGDLFYGVIYFTMGKKTNNRPFGGSPLSGCRYFTVWFLYILIDH